MANPNYHGPQETCQKSFALIKDLKAPLLSKLTILSAFTPSLPNLLATFIWSQIQLFFLIVRSASISLLDSKDNFAAQVLDNIDDNFFFGNIFDFPNYSKLTILILIIAFLYLLFTTAGFVYVLLALKNRVRYFPLIQKTLRIFIDLHPQILFYPIHINAIKLFTLSIDQGQDESLKLPSKFFSLAVLVYNALFTLTITIWFAINTKTKHPFTSKTNLISLLDLLIKIVVPFLWYKGSLSNGLKIILMIGIILFCRCRDWILSTYLPYYRISALKIATISHALLSSLMWSLGFGKVFHWARKDWNQYSVTMLFWVIFGPIFLKLYIEYCHNIRVKILLKPNNRKNTYHFLHYYEICKSFAGWKSTGLTQNRTSVEYMDFVNSLIQSEGAGNLLKEINQDWNSAKQKTVNRYFLKKSMEMIHISSEKNSQLSKLTLARFYSKFEVYYAQASHLIDEGSDSIFQRNSFLYIKAKILKKLQAKSIHAQNKQQLHVGEFIKLQETFKKVQQNFLKNIRLHIEFWKNFQLPKPDLLQLLNLAQKSRYRSRKLKYVTQAAKLFAQQHFPEPLLICGLYFHFFQYEMATAQNLIQEFSQLQQKNKENPHHDGAIETIDNFHKFSSEAIYFVISPAQNKLGQILDCSGRVGSVLGMPKDLLVGQSINTIIPPSFAKYHDSFLKASSHSVLNKTREVTTLMKDGYIASAHLHIALTHVRNFELCYYSLLEPIKDDTRLVIIATNGLMSNCSRNFAEDLGVIDYTEKDSLNIWEVCPDLGRRSSIVKKKLESVVKSIRNSKRTSLGHAHLNNITNALGKTSLVLSEDTHSQMPAVGEQKQKPEEGETGHHVRTISVKEAQLSFFPCWYKTAQEREGVEPLVFQAQIRKFEVAGVEMVELKMKKTSNFSFVPPASMRQSNLKSPRSTSCLQAAKANFGDLLPPMTTMRTENGQLLSPKNSTCLSTLMNSPKISPKNPFLSNVNLSPSMNCETLENPNLIEELILEEDQASPELKRRKIFPGRPKGDDVLDSESSESTEEKKKTEEKMEEILLNVDFALDQKKEEADLLGHILKNSNEEGAEAILENAKSTRDQKILKSILESKKRRKETIAYIVFFLITSGVLLFLLIWLNFYTTTTSKKVAKYSDVLQNAYFRSYWTILGTQNILYWAGVALEWVYYAAGLGVLNEATSYSFERMNSYNQELETSLSDVNSEILELAYLKNVRIFDRDTNNELQFVAYDNTFVATKRIITKGMSIVLGPQVFLTELDQDTMFAIDNSVNDLQVVSQSIITLIKENLFAIFGDTRDTMIRAIGGVFGVVLLFMIFSFRYILQANAEFKRFANVLFTLQVQEVKEIENFAIAFKEILEKDIEAKELLVNLFEIKKNQHEKNFKQDFRKTYDHTKADASVKKIYARNYALFVGLLIFTGFTIGFTSVYYSKASSQLTVMENQHSNINSALSYVNNLAWITIELQLISLLNSTIETRNLPVNETLLNDIEALRDVVTLQDSLKNQDGGFSPSMEAILFNFLCDNAYTPYYSYGHYILRRNCLQTADGGDSIGLLELTARIGATLSTVVPQFLQGPKDIDSLKGFYYGAFYTYGQPCDVEFMLLLNAYAVAEAEFDSLVDDLSDLQVTLAWIAVTISLILGVLVWIFAIRKLTRMELEIKELILLVPSRVIMKNMLLKRYVAFMARSESAKNQALKLLR